MKKEGKNKLSEMELIHPAFPDCDRCIVFCSDNNYMPLTAVAIQSIVETRNPVDQYDILFFHRGIEEKYIDAYQKMFGDIGHFSVRFVNIQGMVEDKSFYVKNRTDFAQEAYYRLFIPWVLDNHYHRALYLDGDMIIRQDIMQIFETDLGDNYIAAVRDYCGICNCYIPHDPRRGYRIGIGLSDIDDYVISSTILFNLSKWRERLSLEKVLSKSTSKQWLQHDQDVLNVLCNRRIRLISPTWGLVSDYGNNHYLPKYLQDELNSVQNPAIFHFAAVRKPYYGLQYGVFDSEFWTTAAHTVYFNYLLKKCRDLEYIFTVLRLIQKESEKSENVYSQIVRGNLAQCNAVDAYGHVMKMSISDGSLHLEGRIVLNQLPKQDPFTIRMTVNGDCVTLQDTYTENAKDGETGEEAFWGVNFSLDYKLNKWKELYMVSFSAVVGERTYPIKTLFQGRFSPLTARFKHSYFYSDGWIIQQKRHFIVVSRCSQWEVRKQEARFLKELNDEGGIAGKKAMLIRPMVRCLRKAPHIPIWLISDRVFRADDNGEALFKYVNTHLRDRIDCYFLIDRKSPDFKRLQQYGKVVPIFSYRHKMLSLVADWSISSHVDEVFRQPFRGFREWYSDLLSHTRFAFLQHGVISPDKDASGFLRRSAQQLDGFVVSAQNEYHLIRDGKYHYDKEIWLTGLPRFDYLEDNREKIVTIMPTRRMGLTVGHQNSTGSWDLKEGFTESEYATFYRKLMQHPRLKAATEQNGYTVQFKVHPCYSGSVEQFGFGSEVLIVPDDISYREIFSKSSLLVTDYSSSIYDFLYLRKPVMYCQYDVDSRFDGHIVHSTENADYERDGFGEVEYDLESTVDRIIEYMENGCQLKPKYRERIDKFFAFHDRNNCKRVAEKILELSEKQQ